jgi:hypothetical protein
LSNDSFDVFPTFCIIHDFVADRDGKGLPAITIVDELERLHQIVNDGKIVRHWLEPNHKAPHVFSDVYSKDWLECLLKITKVGSVLPVNGCCELSQLLWRDGGEHRNLPLSDKIWTNN